MQTFLYREKNGVLEKILLKKKCKPFVFPQKAKVPWDLESGMRRGFKDMEDRGVLNFSKKEAEKIIQQSVWDQQQ